MPENLDVFPLKGLEKFVAEVRRLKITQISLSGTNTDPQLYQHEVELMTYLRTAIPGVKISLHTNGLNILRKMDIFNRYDRASISFPSFQPQTYAKMTGVSRVLNLAEIMKKTIIPIKISTIVTDDNITEIPETIARCGELGISRMVLRKLYGETRQWNLFSDKEPLRHFGGNPVYKINGMEVTVWDFSVSTVRCINLFSDGAIGQEYQLARQQSGGQNNASS
jgi:MoaA/NifB/PqqE/SkfB family radical SAM enzyme